MDTDKLRDLLHRLLEIMARVYLKAKKFIQEWIRIPREAPRWMKLLLAGIYGFALFLFILLAVDINLFWLFGKSPRIADIRNPEMSLTSFVYSSDGKVMCSLFTENRTPAEYKDLPGNLVDALIATEDVRFYKHHGIDIKAAIAAIYSTVKGDRRGGSTITQQLVKNLFKTRKDYSTGLLGYVPGVSTLISKTKEWINALKIELYYSKEEIITMYLNTVDFGSHAYGINSAAATFFDKKPAELTQAQSAVLVGLLKAPSYYSPVSNPRRALARRNQVLLQLEKYDYITAGSRDTLSQLPLGLHYKRRSVSSGELTYLRDAIVRYLQPWSKETDHDVWTDGLKIYTTVDSRMQRYAEESVAEHMKRLQRTFNNAGNSEAAKPWIDEKGKLIPDYFLKMAVALPKYKWLREKFGDNTDSIKAVLMQKHRMKVFTYAGERDTLLSVPDSLKHYQQFFQTGFVAIEPQTGQIKAWVGGIDYRTFKFDHVSQSRRQPGSLFKVFDYAAAFDHGYGPCDRLTDKPLKIKWKSGTGTFEWEPKNVSRSYAGSMTLKHAFARSVNSIAVQLAEIVGWQKVIEYAHRLGIESELEEVPSVSLGSSNVTLLEIVNSYCTFLNGGKRVTPILVTRVEDKDGNIIYQAPVQQKQVLNAETAYLMQVLLRSGLTEPGGTSQGLFEYDLFRSGTEFGGKTGTTSDYTDGWFIGITPSLIAGCWTGNDNMAIHFKSHLGEGSRAALPVFGRFMEKVLRDKNLAHYRQKFSAPAIEIKKKYNCQTYVPKPDTLAAATDSTGEQP